jgi:hypothetical protein
MINHQVKIDNAFATSAFKKLQQQRFGLRSCVKRYELDHIADIRELYIRNAELDPLSLSTGGCTLAKMKEIIQTL